MILQERESEKRISVSVREAEIPDDKEQDL